MGVPQAKLLKVKPSAILDCADEILASRSFAIMALEIEVGPFAKSLHPAKRAHHADHFCALIIDGRCVEIADFTKAVGADGMS